MAESSFTSFFNNGQSFGLNVAGSKTLRQVGQTAGNVAGGVFEPLFSYLEENENVFSGDLTKELNKNRVEAYNTGLILKAADEKANGPRPSFDAKF